MPKSLYPIIDGATPTSICDVVSIQYKNGSFRISTFGSTPELDEYLSPNAEEKNYYVRPTGVFDIYETTAAHIALSILGDMLKWDSLDDLGKEDIEHIRSFAPMLRDFLGKLDQKGIEENGDK